MPMAATATIASTVQPTGFQQLYRPDRTCRQTLVRVVIGVGATIPHWIHLEEAPKRRGAGRSGVGDEDQQVADRVNLPVVRDQVLVDRVPLRLGPVVEGI